MNFKKRATALSVALLAGAGASAQDFTRTPAAAPAGNTWIKLYGEVLGERQFSPTPEDIQATSDGGFIAVAQSMTSMGHETWLIKLDASGNPLWQELVGVPGLPPGSYSIGLSVQQTTDGGYILGGGTLGGGSGDDCPLLSGIECVWASKLDPGGELLWSRAYRAGYVGSSLYKIRNASDGGYIGVGYAKTSSDNYGALLLKLDDLGNIQWQSVLGPLIESTGSTNAIFNDVQQTGDGGYVATGEFYRPRAGPPLTSVLVVKLDAGGNVQWQVGYNNFDGSGSATGAQRAMSIIQNADDGYLVVGSWNNQAQPAGVNALFLKMDSSGNVQWQKAYDGGSYCYFDGYSTRCARIGGLIRSVVQTVDGAYVVGGFSKQIFLDSVPIEAWLAKTDSSGNLLWQYLYYAVLPRTGRPLGEYFAAVAPADDGGFAAIGLSLIYDLEIHDLYVVKTDDAGLVGACGEVYSPPPLTSVDPAMTVSTPSLPVDTAPFSEVVSSPSSTTATSINMQQDCGAVSGPP